MIGLMFSRTSSALRKTYFSDNMCHIPLLLSLSDLIYLVSMEQCVEFIILLFGYQRTTELSRLCLEFQFSRFLLLRDDSQMVILVLTKLCHVTSYLRSQETWVFHDNQHTSRQILSFDKILWLTTHPN